MDKDKGDFVRQYSIDRQNYYIFKTEASEKKPSVHFQWGKFDFRITFKPVSKGAIQKNQKEIFSTGNGKKYLVGLLEVLYQGECFEFVRPTAHGMQLEETLWSRKGQDYYVEFPKDLRNVAKLICAEELGMSKAEYIST